MLRCRIDHERPREAGASGRRTHKTWSSIESVDRKVPREVSIRAPVDDGLHDLIEFFDAAHFGEVDLLDRVIELLVVAHIAENAFVSLRSKPLRF